ncbi:MAG: hypothetical protein K2L13_02500 [Opitutales bacterium]|nr:hypothetical protein [Opitutales bacterium]
MNSITTKDTEIFTVGPSQYHLLNDGTGTLAKWRIVLADDSWRELLNVRSNNVIADFNIRALPMIGLPKEQMEHLRFKQAERSTNSIVFELDNHDLCRTCIPRIKYVFSDLSFKIDLQLENISAFPIYWCPIIRLGLHLPWHENLSLDQYSLCSKSKKRLTLNRDYVILNSGKCPERLSLAGLEDGDVLAVSGIQDPKISINTKNEEESVRIALGGKYQNAYIGLQKTNNEYCTELLCMLDLPSDDDGDLSRCKCVTSEKSGDFSIELSVC